ncbi:MAG: MFS transporter [Candidatus Limnocylindrales bacterium]
MASIPPPARGRLRGLLIDAAPLREDRDFRWLWVGQLVSTIGRQVTLVALPYQVFVMTGSPLAIGGLSMATLVGLLVFTLPGGAIADAYERRRLLLLTQVGLGATSLALGLLALTAAPPLPVIYLLALLAAAISTVDGPARRAAIPRLVPPSRLPAAFVLNQTSYQASSVVGPAVGGLLIAAVGVSAAYLFDAATFLVALGAAYAIAPMPMGSSIGRPTVAMVLEGLRFVRRVPVILSTFVIDLSAMIFGLPVALFPILALETFHGGATTLGLLTAAPAVGALIGTLTAGWVGAVRYQGRAVIAAVTAWGAAICAFGLLVFSLPLALLCLAIAGAADVLSAVFRTTITQTMTPDPLRGRVSALTLLVVTGGPRLGDVEATAVAAVAGAQFSAFSGGVLCLIGTAFVAWRFPQLAAYRDRSRDADPPAVAPTGQSPAPGT